MDILTGTGRVGRLNYFATSLTISFVVFFLAFVTAGEDPATGQATISPIFFFVVILSSYLNFTNMIRRLHDCGRSGWTSLLLFVPIIGLGLALYLLFAPGDSVRNLYGPPPGTSDPKVSIDAQRQRMELIAAAAGEAYRAKGQASYLNDDGSYNMDGLNSDSSGAFGGSTEPPEAPTWGPPPSHDAPDPSWAPPSHQPPPAAAVMPPLSGHDMPSMANPDRPQPPVGYDAGSVSTLPPPPPPQ